MLAGGRYDGLAETLGSKVPAPGVGFSMGEDRLVISVEASGMPAVDPLVVVAFTEGEATRNAAVSAAAELRWRGEIRAEVVEGKLKKVFEVANKLNARVAMICGETEVAAGTLSIKDYGKPGAVGFPSRGTFGTSGKMSEQVALDFLGRAPPHAQLRRAARLRRRQTRPVDGLGASPPRSWRGAVRESEGSRRRDANCLPQRRRPGVHAKAEQLSVGIRHRRRGPRCRRATTETINPSLSTGEVEVVAEKLWILNESRTPPFPMEEATWT